MIVHVTGEITTLENLVVEAIQIQGLRVESYRTEWSWHKAVAVGFPGKNRVLVVFRPDAIWIGYDWLRHESLPWWEFSGVDAMEPALAYLKRLVTRATWDGPPAFWGKRETGV